MLNLALRLFALRPLLSIAIFGVPILVLAAIGLLTIVFLKTVLFVAVPVLLVIWLWRRR